MGARHIVPDIAQAHAFCDQSAFTHHFSKRSGLTPKKFSIRHQGWPSPSQSLALEASFAFLEKISHSDNNPATCLISAW